MDSNEISKLISGAVEMHVHGAPDPYVDRRLDALAIGRRAADAGMKAVVFKAHSYCTAPVASMVNECIGTDILIGSIALNRHVGGLNPDAVEAAAKGGAKVVWMPTVSAITHEKDSNKVIQLINKDGVLSPAIMPILDIIKHHNMVLATGHISAVEVNAIVSEAIRRQIKIIVTHPLAGPDGGLISIEKAKSYAAMGACIEHTFLSCMSPTNLSPAAMVENIKAIGPERCILSTDFGQAHNPPPFEGFCNMLECMLSHGLAVNEIETMIRINPAKLLNLA